MPSKVTFALVALLAAASSVSALPTGTLAQPNGAAANVLPPTGAVVGGPAPGVIGGPVPPIPDAQAQPLPQAGAQSLTSPPAALPHHQHRHHHHPQRAGSVHHPQQLSAQGLHPHGHSHSHPHSNSHPHPHSHLAQQQSGAVMTNPMMMAQAPAMAPPVVAGAGPLTAPPPTGMAPTLAPREFYENLVEDLVARHTHGEGHWHGHSHHHHHPGGHPMQMQSDPSAGVDPNAQVDPNAGSPGMARREVLERRGFLEAIGLKAYQKDFTKAQSDRMTAAEKACDALPSSSKKDKSKCHDALKRIAKLEKEMNHYVAEFTDKSHRNDLFPYADGHFKASHQTVLPGGLSVGSAPPSPLSGAPPMMMAMGAPSPYQSHF